MKRFRMAWRNIRRGGRRSVVTIAAMAFGLLMMILYSGLVQGYLAGMERNVVELELGDVQLHTPGYRDDPSLYEAIPEPEALLGRLDALGYPASARLLGGALAAGTAASTGVLLQGLDVARDARVSTLPRHLAQGSWLDPADPRGVVLGRRLARTLDLRPGDELVLLSQAYDGTVANDLFRVRGVLKGISDATDRGAVFLTAQAFRDFFILPAGAHRIVVRRPAGSDLAVVTARVREAAPGLDVQNWRELEPAIANLLDSTQGLMIYVFLIVYVAIGILILNAMLMAVFERIREFGVLKALGAGPFEVFGLILIESGVQVLIAVTAGLVLSVPLLWYLATLGINLGSLGGMSVLGVAFDPLWTAVISPAVFLGPLLSLLAIVAAAVIYPAAKAALLDPVQALHHH